MSTIKNPYWNFWFFQKHKSSAQSLNFDWMWLVNELVLTFSAAIKCAKAQLNLIILSRVMPHTTYYRHFRKNRFFWHKTNTFSYDENVKWIAGNRLDSLCSTALCKKMKPIGSIGPNYFFLQGRRWISNFPDTSCEIIISYNIFEYILF